MKMLGAKDLSELGPRFVSVSPSLPCVEHANTVTPDQHQDGGAGHFRWWRWARPIWFVDIPRQALTRCGNWRSPCVAGTWGEISCFGCRGGMFFDMWEGGGPAGTRGFMESRPRFKVDAGFRMQEVQVSSSSKRVGKPRFSGSTLLEMLQLDCDWTPFRPCIQGKGAYSTLIPPLGPHSPKFHVLLDDMCKCHVLDGLPQLADGFTS